MTQNAVQVDVVLDKMARRVAQLELDKAVLEATVESLNQKVAEFENTHNDQQVNED